MASLADMKASSPAYAQMSDDEFAEKVFQKHYAGKMTREEFNVRTGAARPDYRPEPMLGGAFQRLSDQMADPFGVQDEFVGAGQFARKLLTTGSLSEAADAYTKAAETIRAERKIAREDYGILPEIVGGIGTAGASVAKAGGSLLSRIGQSAKAGATAGAAAGVGHGEGGVVNRGVSGLYGAGGGAVAGPVLSEVVGPIAAKGVSAVHSGAQKAGTFLRDTLGDLVPALRRSTDARFVRSLQRQNMTVDDAAAAYEKTQAAGKFGKSQSEVPTTLADLGPAAQRQGRAIATIPGRGSTMADEVYGARQQGQFGRMNDFLRRSLQVSRDDYAKTSERLVREMKEAATPAYLKFFRLRDQSGRPVRYDIGEVLRKSEMQDAQLSPSLQRMMRKARSEFMGENVVRDMGRDMNAEVLLGRDAVMGRSPTYKLTGQRFDSGKQALDDMIEQAKARGQNNQVRLLTELKSDVVGVVDRQSMRPVTRKQTTDGFDANGKKVKISFDAPELDANGQPVMRSLYAEARDAYGTPASLKDALTAGRSFMKGDSDMTGAAYKALSTAEKRMFRLGVAREANKVLGGKQIGQDMIGHFRRPNVQEALAEVMSPAKFKQFMELVDIEKGMAQSSTTIRGGSPTANKQADVEDLNAFMSMGRVLKDKGLAGAAFDAVGGLVERTLRMREVDAHQLARLMFETDPPKIRATLARLKSVYGPKRVQNAMTLIQDRVGSLTTSVSAEAGEQGAVIPEDLALPVLP